MQPVIKWVGGKSQFISKIKDKIGQACSGENARLVEPFVGGGSVFLNLVPSSLWINDINPQLVNMYQMVKTQPNELLGRLQEMVTEMNQHVKKNDAPKRNRRKQDNRPQELIDKEDYYYKIRDIDVSSQPPIRQAAIFIFLNKTCFRGLYRENSSGKFNVPFGNYSAPAIVNEENLLTVSEYLNRVNAKITNLDYKSVLENIQDDDVVYLDPPYYPVNKTSFTQYTKHDFSIEEQERLVGRLAVLRNKFLLSNYPHPEYVKRIAKERNFRYETFVARRAIDVSQGERNPDKLKPNEILVWNF